MDIDWAVSLIVFLVFVSWTISIYTAAYTPRQTLAVEEAALDSAQKVADFLTVEVNVVNLNVSRANSSYTVGRNETFYFNYTWPYGKNTSRIYLNDISIPCWMNANNDTVYFNANVSAGTNYYTMRYRNESTTMNCTSSFGIVNESRLVPWPAVKRYLLSATQINALNSTTYDTMRSNLSIAQNFQIEFNISGSLSTYGPALPTQSNVYVRTVRNRVEETGQNATLTIAVW